MSVLISVVIATYNRPALLLKCLQSLTIQNFDTEAFEIIVVSDGPDNFTKKAVESWVKKRPVQLRFFNLPDKMGPAAARNYGWVRAKGELIAFTDDDCLPQKNWLSAYVEQYRLKHDVVFTGKTVVPVGERPTDYELNTAHLQTADFITANCCCLKTALEKVGGFDERFSMAWREDSDLEFKLIKQNIEIIKTADAVVVHPVRKSFWGISIREQKKTMYNVLLYKKFPDLYRQKIQAKPPLNYYAIIFAFAGIFIGIIIKSLPLVIISFFVWKILMAMFVYKRLSATSLSAKHVLEMMVTSCFIPFLSVYWQFYGAIKYRVLFI